MQNHSRQILAAGLCLLGAAELPAQRPEDRPLPPAPPVHAEYKFDFGPGKARDGSVPVAPEAIYSSERGYGFDFGSKPVGVNRSGADPVTDGFVTTNEPPLFFSVKVPEGNYRITVTLGDAAGESRTTIRTEAAHLMAADVVTARGQFATRTFYANVRRPQLPPPPRNAPGGTDVHMFLAGEAEARCWDEKLTIEFNGPRPCLGTMEIVKDDTVPTIFVAGDSTVGDPRRGPGGNWPTQICQFFKPEIVVCNSAEGGETTKSFITGYRFDKVLSRMKAGDFFLIQFGHNDSKPQWPQSYTEPGTSFNAYLRVFIAETRRRGATPVLVTPMERRNNGDTVGPWARAMRDVAEQEKVPLIDQWAMSKELWTALGPTVNQAFNDQTHLSGYGGYLLSKLIVGGISKNVPALARFVVDDFREMDPARPEPPPEYLQQAPGPGVASRGREGAEAAPALAATDSVSPAPRERLRMDAGWRFSLGDPSDPARDFDFATGYFSYLAKAGYGDGPAAATFDDRAWRRLDLPHDWAVEAPFDARGSASHGFKAIGRNFPERSIGWYRKTFTIPASDLDRRISVEFDGVFRDSMVWVNGFYLGRHPSGYTGFRYDLTDYLNYGGDNVIAVRVNAAMEEGWFYEGAGIYRHVWLVKTAPLHVAHWGTYVTTEVGEGAASVSARTTVTNTGTGTATFEVGQKVVDPDGRVVATRAVSGLSLAAGATGGFPCEISVPQPRLWSIETPALYRLVTTILTGGAVVDRYETTFGIRTIRFDPDHGFFLNGRHVELHGTNNHQDHAGVGVALPDALQAFRVARLKEMGVNAYRCSHNPPSPELLDACDRLGLLVIDENRLMGANPAQLGDLESMIHRDRNHPSIILWSLGNEEWAIEGNVKGARIAATMQAFARRLDPTRETTYANSGGWGGISTVIDVIGYNYIAQSNPDEQHAKFPRQPGVGTEETTTQGTRGIYVDDRPQVHLAPLSRGDSGGNCEKGWQYYAARPFLAGLFFWTGFDYRGEPTPFGWPAISTQFGLLDTCGFPKDSSSYLKSWWTDQPVLHLYPHWNWPGREGQEITVVCFSNDEAVELWLNGVALGKKDMPRNGHLEWKVAYAPGALEARGYRAGRVVETTRVETTGVPAQLALTPDRTTINADGEDVAVFTVSARDAQGRAVPTAANRVDLTVTGGRIIGVGNGDPGCHDPDQFNEGVTLVEVSDWRGRIAPAAAAIPSAPDSGQPFPQLGNWLAPLPKPGEVYDLSGAFSLPAVPAGARLKLFLPTFGVRTTLWLNGHELARDLDTSAARPAIPLEAAQLVAGVNRVQLRVTPFEDKRNHIPELTRLGAVRVATPAPPAWRSLFNGLAQVIVQSTSEPGEIRLTARSEGLIPAESTIVARPSALRAVVP